MWCQCACCYQHPKRVEIFTLHGAGGIAFIFSHKNSKNLVEELRHVSNRVGTLQNGDISDNLGNSYSTYFIVGWVKD